MAEKKYDCILFEVADGVGRITLNLPQFGNALTVAGIEELLDALNACEARDDVGAVLLTGAGKAFCAGFNLKEIPLDSDDTEAVADHFRSAAMWWHQVMHKIVRIERPVLTAVNGVAAGVGLGIALCSDIVICHEKARFLCAWHTIGLANDATTSYSLAKVVGWRRAFELMMTNRTLSAEDAVDWGIANRAYGDADFAVNVDQVARELAAGPTHLQAMARDSFHSGWRRSVEEATEYEIQNVMKSVRHPYFREAVRKFVKGEIKADIPQVRLP
jgi:2-(1,2-epoxy-1,2-dihydrophenyl)acetyl-CoA isomerase